MTTLNQPADDEMREAYASWFKERHGWYDEPLALMTGEWEAWQAALAAYLPRSAATVSDEPIKDGEIAKIVNQIRDIAVKFHGAQQLRERIAHVLVPILRATSLPRASEQADEAVTEYRHARDEARRTAEYWKAEHLAGNKRIAELEARAAASAQPRCEYCDGTGDVHGFDGEWRGECTNCDAAASAQATRQAVAEPIYQVAFSDEDGWCDTYKKVYDDHPAHMRRIVYATPPQDAAQIRDAALTDRIIAAIEGECDGLAITDEQASSILAYLQYGAAMDEVQAIRRDAERYRKLRSADIDAVHKGGVFAGLTPDNVVINGEDLDIAVDLLIDGAALSQPAKGE